jgi:tetratricopeptide (TPR) repeat protein
VLLRCSDPPFVSSVLISIASYVRDSSSKHLRFFSQIPQTNVYTHASRIDRGMREFFASAQTPLFNSSMMVFKLIYIVGLLYCATCEAAGILEKLSKLFGGGKIAETVVPAGESQDWLVGGLKPDLSETDMRELIAQSAELIKQGKMESSIPDLLAALESDPDNMEANILLGTIFLELGRPDQAESFLYKAVTLTGYANVVPIVNLMSALKQNGDAKLAIEVGQSALDAGKLDTRMKVTVAEVLGNLHVGLSSYEQASDWYFFAAMLVPSEASTQLWLQASSLMFPTEQRSAEVAKSVLLEAIKAKPLDPQIVFYLGLATDAGGNVEEGIKLYKSAIDLDRQLEGATVIPDVWASLGTALQSLGRLQEADDCYTKSYALNRDNGNMLVNWAVTSAQLGQPEKCLQAANEAMRILGRDNDMALSAVASCGA